MKHSGKWPERVLSVVGVLAIAIGTLADINDAKQLVAELPPIMFYIVAALTQGGAGGLWVGRYRWAHHPRRKAPANHLVELLHARWFPGQAGDKLNELFRVSYFVPASDGKSWKCLARTIKSPSRASEWLIPGGARPEAWNESGLVVFSAKERTNSNVRGLPKGAQSSAEDIANYRRETKITQERHRNISWRYASIVTMVVSDQAGNVIAVLVVEREDGREIPRLKTLLKEGDLATSVWSAAWEGAVQ